MWKSWRLRWFRQLKLFRGRKSLIKGKGYEAQKNHVNAIIDEDLWQVVKEEKLRVGDFKVESTMAVYTGVYRHNTRNFDRWSHTSTDRHTLSSTNRHHTWIQLDHLRQWGSWPTKSSQLDTLIQPKPYRVTTEDIDWQHQSVSDRQNK